LTSLSLPFFYLFLSSFSPSQRGTLFKNYEERADSVRRNSAHLVAKDLGKLSVFGFEKKGAEMR